MQITEQQLQTYKKAIESGEMKPTKTSCGTYTTIREYHLHGVVLEEIETKGATERDYIFFTPQEWQAYKKTFQHHHGMKKAEEAIKPTGLELVSQERARHFELGYDAEHDSYEVNGELAAAAALYAVDGTYLEDMLYTDATEYDKLWPWPESSYPDKRGKIERIRELTVAGALIAAEIDRLQAK